MELIRDRYMYALKTWESPVKKMLSKYKEYVTEDEEFIMTAAEQLKQKGALEKAQEIALNMLTDGFSIDAFSRYTKLDPEDLNEL